MQKLHVHGATSYIIICTLLIVVSDIVLMCLTSPQRKALAVAPAVKIMPLGDSITGSPGCWRALLWNMLQKGGYTTINMVGSLNNSSSCGILFDGHNEGHGGFLATKIADQKLLIGWAAATHPKIVMMHLGTNDVWSNIPTATILAAYTTLVKQMRMNNPRMRIIVAQILPMNPTGCAYCAQGVITLDNAIPAWASSMSTVQSPIVVVNQWTGFNDSTDTREEVHPNSLGDQKIANKMYPVLKAQLDAIAVESKLSATAVIRKVGLM